MGQAVREFDIGLVGPGRGRTAWDVVADVRRMIDEALERYGKNGDTIWALSLKSFKEVATSMGNAIHLRYRAEALTKQEWRARFESRAAPGEGPKKKRIKTPAGRYRPLTQRDVLQAGDEVCEGRLIWRAVAPEDVGQRKGDIYGWYVKARRRKD